MRIFAKIIILSAFLALLSACGEGKTAITTLTVSKDPDGKLAATSFKGGDGLFANATLANLPVKGKLIFSIKNEKGAILPGTESKVDLSGTATAAYKVQIAEKAPGGKYILTADLYDGNGEKKDTKSTDILIEGNVPKP